MSASVSALASGSRTLTICTTKNDRTRANDFGPLDQNQLIIANPLLHNLLSLSQISTLERLIAIQIGQAGNHCCACCFRDSTQVFLLATTYGHGSCFDKFLEAQVVNSFCCEDDIGSCREDFAHALDRDICLAVGVKDIRRCCQRRALMRPARHVSWHSPLANGLELFRIIDCDVNAEVHTSFL